MKTIKYVHYPALFRAKAARKKKSRVFTQARGITGGISSGVRSIFPERRIYSEWKMKTRGASAYARRIRARETTLNQRRI